MKKDKCSVYWNSHKKLFSVRKNNKVIAHRKTLYLKNCDFIVNEKGRQRVIKEKRKNVHAFIVGEITNKKELNNFLEIEYNPYRGKNFHIKDSKTSILFSDYCCLSVENNKAIIKINNENKNF